MFGSVCLWMYSPAGEHQSNLSIMMIKIWHKIDIYWQILQLSFIFLYRKLKRGQGQNWKCQYVILILQMKNLKLLNKQCWNIRKEENQQNLLLQSLWGLVLLLALRMIYRWVNRKHHGSCENMDRIRHRYTHKKMLLTQCMVSKLTCNLKSEILFTFNNLKNILKKASLYYLCSLYDRRTLGNNLRIPYADWQIFLRWHICSMKAHFILFCVP